MTDYLVRLSVREQLHVDAEAARTGEDPDVIVGRLASAAALRLDLRPPAGTGKHRSPKETQTEKRARLRADSPDGMSPFTREIQTITTGRNQA